MKIKSIILLVELEDGSIRELAMTESKRQELERIVTSGQVAISKTDLSSVIEINNNKTNQQ